MVDVIETFLGTQAAFKFAARPGLSGSDDGAKNDELNHDRRRLDLGARAGARTLRGLNSKAAEAALERRNQITINGC